MDAAGGNLLRFSSQPHHLSKRPGCFLIATISMALTFSGQLTLCLAHSDRGVGEGREEVQNDFVPGVQQAPGTPTQLLLARTCCSPFPGDTLADPPGPIILCL